MSRRKQARPKSCKLEGMVDKREEETCASSLHDLSVPTVSTSSSRDGNLNEGGTSVTSLQLAVGDNQMKATGGGGTESAAAAGSNSPVFRCETCSAVFDTLDHFMDHRNFVCISSSMETSRLSWPAQDKSEWNESDSNSDSPFLPSVEGGIGSSLPLHLDEEQLPYAIGISEANPYGCQYCEKAFPQTCFLYVHERVHSDQLPFKCDHCHRLFQHKRNRDRHSKLHASVCRIQCTHCDARFSKREELRSHLQTHESSKLYPCPICQSGYSSAVSLTSHLLTHQDVEATSVPAQTSCDLSSCAHCGQSFETVQLMQEHMSIHTAAIKVEQFSCDICSQQFTSQETLDAHMDRVHYNKAQQPMDVDPAILMLKCPVCPLSFPDTLSLCQHLMSHTASPSLTLTSDINHSVMVRNGKDLLEMSSSKDGSRTHTPKRSASVSEMSPGGSKLPKNPQALVCPYCLSDSFDSLEVLELHMQSIHSVKSSEIYTCNYCNAPYPNLYSLHDHMNVVHRNHPGIGIKYPCSLCNNQFPSIEALAKHKSLSHSYPDGNDGGGHLSGIDSAFCSHCAVTFPTARQLEDHMVSVHGASIDKKPGKCRGRKSSSKGNKENKQGGSKSKMLRQMSSVTSSAVTDSSTPTSPARTPACADSITCDECNATFHELANFQAHMKLHLDAALAKFTCKKCGQQLGSQEQLEAHLSLHYLCLATEYGCTSCMKLFSKPDELQKHLMDIHAHHLYRCALCKEIFDSKVNIQVHFAIKHSNECKLFKCTQCSNIFRSEMEWQVHVRVNHLHLAKPYRCLFCAESFTSEMELQCHLTTHSKPFRCTMCEQAFHIEYLLDQHMQTEHADADTKAAVAALLSPVPSSLNNISIKEEADSSTSVLSSLVQTRSPRPPSQNSDTGKSISPTVPQSSVSPLTMATSSAVWKNSEAVHVCNICDSRFTQQALLTIHKAQEHGLRTVGIGSNSLLSPSGKGRSTNISPVSNFMAPAATVQSSREKFLQQNQTLVSVLTDNQSSIPMACTLCSQTFRNQTECDKHMKIHANSTSLKCNICDETFPSGSTLAEHKLQHCKIHQGNICFVCKLSLKTEEQFYSHAQEHGYQGSLLQCIVCRQTLASVVELQMHGKHHYQVRPSFYTCCVCLKTFDSKENLVSKLNSSGRTYYVCKPCYHGESPLHTCSHCSEKFASKAQLDAHMATHSSTGCSAVAKSMSFNAPQTFQCIKCQESFTTEYEIQLHVANHMLQEGTTHECKLCTLVFESPAKLQCHLIEHTFKNDSEIHCAVCERIFSSAAEIQVHALEHGVPGRRHTCGQCSQRFFFSAELDNHVLIYNHSPAAVSSVDHSHRYECLDCIKVFSSATALANHRKTHDRRDAGLRCSLCTQTFTSISLMQKHFLASHMGGLDFGGNENISEKRRHTCSECKQSFVTAESLQVHMGSSHKSGSSSLICPVCSKSFSQTKMLTIHLRSHMESKPYPCSVCQKRFSREENLKAHMKSHAALPTLVCPLCNQSFSQRADITEHLKTHFSTPESDQQNTTVQQTLSETLAAAGGGSESEAADTSPDTSGKSVLDVNGLPEDGSKTAVELIIPDPQNRGSKCKQT